MSLPIAPTGLLYKALSASGVVKSSPGTCALLLCSASTSLVVNVYDNTTAAGTKIVDSLPVDAKEEFDIPAQFSTGLYVEFVSGSGKVTVFYV
jgi:hypothetical protein